MFPADLKCLRLILGISATVRTSPLRYLEVNCCRQAPQKASINPSDSAVTTLSWSTTPVTYYKIMVLVACFLVILGFL